MCKGGVSYKIMKWEEKELTTWSGPRHVKQCVLGSVAVAGAGLFKYIFLMAVYLTK